MSSAFQTRLSAELKKSGWNAGTRKHIKRWADDDRADEIWERIESAAQAKGTPLPAWFFIQEILSARRVALLINKRQTQRGLYRKMAARMIEVAAFLDAQPPDGGPPPIPHGPRLALELKDAAKDLEQHEAAVSWVTPGQVKVSRSNRDRVRVAFTSMVSGQLQRATGRWLDAEVAVLTEIALNVRDITIDQVRSVRRAANPLGRVNRGSARKRRSLKKSTRKKYNEINLLDAEWRAR
jgi:hypothetical protein